MNEKGTFYYAFKIIYTDGIEDFAFDTDKDAKNIIKDLETATVAYKIFKVIPAGITLPEEPKL